jgi:hypothetical protein
MLAPEKKGLAPELFLVLSTPGWWYILMFYFCVHLDTLKYPVRDVYRSSNMHRERRDIDLSKKCSVAGNQLLAFPSSLGGFSKALIAALSSANKDRNMRTNKNKCCDLLPTI